MSDSYVIQWKSKVNGRFGRGTRTFSRSEAEELTNELNAEYPDILHEAVPARPPGGAGTKNAENDQPETEPEDEAARKPVPASLS